MATFQETKQDVLELFGEGLHFLRGRGDTDVLQVVEAARERLENGRFTVVVAGKFKQGESSLLNALLEEPGLFPVDLDIATNLVTTIAYGPEEKITVMVGERGKEKPRRITRSEIAECVTEQHNPARRRKHQARLLVIETPNPRLRKGLVLVDTPGVGGLNEEHTDITYAFIPNADAVLFTSDAMAPLDTEELEFVERITEHTRHILFITT